MKHFGRMPRKGCNRVHQLYDKKFDLGITMTDLKKKAEIAVVDEGGKRCLRELFSEHIRKKTKTMVDIIETNTLRDLKLYQSARDQILKELGNFRSMKIEEVPRTTKIPYEKLDSELVENLNQALSEIIQARPSSTWSEVARLLQATQPAYQSLKASAKVKSTWNENILKKVDDTDAAAEILRKVRDNALKPGSELSRGMKIMREPGLILERKDDIVQAISKMTEKAADYQRKLDTHARRKSFSKANRTFEMYRSRFCRDLGGEPISPPSEVPAEKVKEFWATMWTMRRKIFLNICATSCPMSQKIVKPSQLRQRL